MTQPTQNPIPSGNILDQIFNAEKIDEVVNSGSEQYTDRLGVKRFTIAGLTALVRNLINSISGNTGGGNVGLANDEMLQSYLDKYENASCSIFKFLSPEEARNANLKLLVNIDQAVASAADAGVSSIKLPPGHFEFNTTTMLYNVCIVGSNESEAPDLQLEATDGSSGKLSLNTKGTVLHLTGNSAANGITFNTNTPSSSVVGVSRCSVYYPDQDWANWSVGGTDIDGVTYYQPTVYPAAFIINGGMRAFFDKVFFINAYQWIEIRDTQIPMIGKIAGTLINRGVQITRMGAGGYTDTVNSYPFWTWACGFRGNSMRANLYQTFKGICYEVGNDDGTTRTVEQMLINRLNVIGCADGLICGGKGVTLNSAKFDNCMRAITVNSLDNSAYHSFSNVWASCYYNNNYVFKQRTDGSVYVFSTNSSTPVNINNFNVVRSDGIGINMPYASGSNISNVVIQQLGWKGFVLGSAGRSTDVLNVNTCNVNFYTGDSALTQIGYEIGDFVRCSIKGLQYKGGSNVTPYVMTGTLNPYESGKEIDLSSLDGPLYKGVSQSIVSVIRGRIRRLVGVTASSTDSVLVTSLSGTNTGGTALNCGVGVRNTVSTGNGHGVLVLYSSKAGELVETAEVFNDGAVLGVRPRSTTAVLGDTSNPWNSADIKTIRATSSITLNGNPVGVKVSVPASATATGVVGQWAADTTYIYICVATNTWVRASLATW
ncbi:hypothetical protein KPN8_76 [Klebsiella phage KPN8]|nr:hypothetical protein KPN8_76 [Klebsiella phage KPN8]